MGASNNSVQLLAVRHYRMARGERLGTFWSRVGVTKFAGSNYERGALLPAPVALLLILKANGWLSAEALQLAHAQLDQARHGHTLECLTHTARPPAAATLEPPTPLQVINRALGFPDPDG